jgi:hypothetical protein
MELGRIYNSMQAWNRLVQLSMSPKVAYKLFKYIKLVSAEYDIVEKARVKIIRDVTQTKDGEDASITPDTPEMGTFFSRFNEHLGLESELKPCELKFDAVIDALEDKPGNALTPQETGLLEVFFKE